MKNFTFTLTATSVKEVNITAHTLEDAGKLIQRILVNSNALDFNQDDVSLIDISGELSEEKEDKTNCLDCSENCEDCETLDCIKFLSFQQI